MGKGPRYRVPFRRRRTNQTDYRMRKAMIRSATPRLVVRISSKYVYIQLAEAHPFGDTILATSSSKELEKYGWKASYRNTSAAYLCGLLLGKRTRTIGVKDAILDIGLRRPSPGARVFAALKGVIDAGLSVPYDERVLPSEERIRSEHVALYAKKLLEEDEQLYGRLFSQHLKKGLKPEQLTEYFNHVRDNILNNDKGD